MATKERRRQLLVLLIPTTALIGVFIVVPLLFVTGLSTFKFSLVETWTNRFVGLQNFITLAQSARFWNSLRVALILGVATVSLQVITGFVVALLLHSKIPGSKWTRTMFLLPMTVPPIVGSVIWKLLFNQNLPAINYLFGLVGLGLPVWFGTPFLAMVPIVVANVWQTMPFVLLILLAGLESLPTGPFESAKVDGASRLQSFWHITLPLIMPVLIFAITFRAIDSLKIFPLIVVMTDGGPGIATEAINIFAYKSAFVDHKMGLGSAVIVVMIIIVAILVFLMRRSDAKDAS